MEVSEEEVDNFSFRQAVQWLVKRGHDPDELVELSEMINFIKKVLRGELNQETSSSDQHADQPQQEPKKLRDSQRIMEEILRQDRLMKDELSAVYLKLAKFLTSDSVGDDTKAVLREIHGDYLTTIASYNSELVNDECPIVVAGETSAGKSSLLNLLLGTEVLPHSLLCATSTICRLHNSDTKEFVIENADGKQHCFALEGNSFGEQLKPYVSSTAENRTETQCKQVDIYWPIPMLPNRVTIVDTPGIGESKDMTDRLMNYLPNAVAFIYVINSAIAGGIQEDKLLHIINEQRRWEKEGKLSTFDQSCAIFVCNKWDQVKESGEADKVLTDTVSKLSKSWPNLKEDQVFRMSTTEAARYMKTGMGHTDMFQKLLDGIERMVPASLEAKVRRHFIWLEKFLQKLQSSITSRINHARTTEEEKKKLQDIITQRLHRLRLDSDHVRAMLHEEAEQRCEEISRSLFAHMQQDDTRDRLCQWRESDCPDISAGDFEVTKFMADKIIAMKVQDEIDLWESEKQNVKKLSESLMQKFYKECDILGKECLMIDTMVEGSNRIDLSRLIPNPSKPSSESIFTRSEKAVLAVTAPLWFPLVAVASIVFIPVGLTMLIRESVIDNQARKKYEENRVDFMRKWSQEFLEETFTETKIHEFVYKVYFEKFTEKINAICKDIIPRQIAADEKMINNIATDRRSSQEILKHFLPLLDMMKELMGDFLLFRLRYMSKDLVPVDNIQRKEMIGKGTYSDVYLVDWNKDGTSVHQAALKVLRKPLVDDTYAQLTELDCLRNLAHENIVEFYGVSFETTNNSGFSTSATLMLLMEYCEDSLEHIVFTDEKKQCRFYGDKLSRHEAFVFYITMATGICDGLAHIHGRKYVHRDLKLTNVLVKGGVAKVCDVGFARQEQLLTGTFVGTVTHMAPEVNEQKIYTVAVDIYSLGILLWELWYGRHAYSEQVFRQYSVPQLLDLIRDGLRPLAGAKFCPFNELSALMEACWEKEASKRPSAAEVAERLERIYCSYYDDGRFKVRALETVVEEELLLSGDDLLTGSAAVTEGWKYSHQPGHADNDSEGVVTQRTSDAYTNHVKNSDASETTVTQGLKRDSPVVEVNMDDSSAFTSFPQIEQ